MCGVSQFLATGHRPPRSTRSGTDPELSAYRQFIIASLRPAVTNQREFKEIHFPDHTTFLFPDRFQMESRVLI